MGIADIWRNVSERIGFYTKETRHEIPEGPGIYAWFIPLWIYATDIEKYIGLINSIFLYDPSVGGKPVRNIVAKYNWDVIQVRLEKGLRRTISPDIKELWNLVFSNPELREALEYSLMEATILMPPIYIGRTDNLSARYYQHVKGTQASDSSFHNRFSQFIEKSELNLDVKDLLFVCISTDPKIDKALKKKVLGECSLNILVERLVMLLALPPFSLR